ncbi:MAG: HIT domain-containing protein [Sedimentisphaerales bacterium]|nr:HIT domain-containing protein [Sedimentisphaerales bacterium]
MERKNLWAPWRVEYIQGLNKSGDCFICQDLKEPQDDGKNLVLWRSEHCIVVLNRFPYNNGHLLIAPGRHISDLEEATDEELLELTKLVRETKKALTLVLKPHGFNVGMNFGRCSGAGLPGHLHIHIVPRWDGDTNFMNVCTDTNVVSQSLTELLGRLKQISKENNLPAL